jgi:hypothetical protein
MGVFDKGKLFFRLGILKDSLVFGFGEWRLRNLLLIGDEVSRWFSIFSGEESKFLTDGASSSLATEETSSSLKSCDLKN